MNIRPWILALLALGFVGLLSSLAGASALDRVYLMGDALGEGASNNNPVSVTWDTEGESGQAQLIDLTAFNGPTYTTISGRPDGVGGLGIQFDMNSSQYLSGLNLGLPSASVSTVHPQATLNYFNISDRGLQFWVNPSSAAAQSLVMDTNQHGARINSSGNFSMRYAGLDYDSSVTATAGNWYHVMVVRPQGAANGARMYIDGIAVAVAPGGYDGTDTTDLYVGTNTTFSEFFSGTIDDLKMFVIGFAPETTTPPRPAADYGPFSLALDNDFVSSPVTGLSGMAGDVDNDGLLTQADKDDFIAGWLNQNLIDGIQVGDLSTYARGDLNMDGITDIQDLLQMQLALSGSGVGAITAADLAGTTVPEPSAVALVLLAMAGIAAKRRR